MKFGVITFPGSNCNEDMIYVLRNIMGQEVVELWHKDHDLQGADFIVLPGGFSYGDYLRSGAIAQFSPIMREVIDFANKGGYVFGVCNGFQILCETELLPGTLLHNMKQQFICKNVHLSVASADSVITRNMQKGQVVRIPIAHGEGNYYDHPDRINKLEDNDQVLFRYCDVSGNVSSAANPNGSVNNIAGVCNQKRNVFGMMPHPERAVSDDLGGQGGLPFFASLLEVVG